jgi:hypothetical protein
VRDERRLERDDGAAGLANVVGDADHMSEVTASASS